MIGFGTAGVQNPSPPCVAARTRVPARTPTRSGTATRCSTATPSHGADDVVGHELSHGVTDKHSGLMYFFQSGAINESLSDMLGENMDLRFVTDGDTRPTG